MASDVQNQQLAEWLRMSGCPVELSSQDLLRLNAPDRRSAWRHLQNHVKPTSSVRMMKKNLLLAQLRSNSSLPASFTKFKIQSVEELIQLQKHSAAEEEIHDLKTKITSVDKDLMSANISLVSKVTEKEIMRNDLEEMQNKSALLNEKLALIGSDLEKLDEKLELVKHLDPSYSTEMLYMEGEKYKFLVSKFVQKVASIENADDCMSEMVLEISEFPPSITFDGILSVTNNVLKTLNRFKFAEHFLSQNYSQTKDNINDLELSKDVKDLNEDLNKNEIELHRCVERIVESKTELGRQQAALVTIMEEFAHLESKQDDQILTLVELMRKNIENILTNKIKEKVKNLKEELEDACFSCLESDKWILSKCEEEDDILLTAVNEKLHGINKILKDISIIQISLKSNKDLQEVKNLSSSFLAQFENNTEEENKFQILVSEDLIGQEIEMFLKIPLFALGRQWEDNIELIPTVVREEILKNSDFLWHLLQSKPKNLIKSIIEKMCWLRTNQC